MRTSPSSARAIIFKYMATIILSSALGMAGVALEAGVLDYTWMATFMARVCGQGARVGVDSNSHPPFSFLRVPAIFFLRLTFLNFNSSVCRVTSELH
eukprot:scaffold36452_cov40-Prasinocladus_malaysianus.AAC.2